MRSTQNPSALALALVLAFISQISAARADSVSLSAGTAPAPPPSPDLTYAVHAGRKSKYFWLPIVDKPADPYSYTVSKDAIQLAGILKISEQLRTLESLQKLAAAAGPNSVSAETRAEITNLKVELLAVIEDARLQIDFACAELEEEESSCDEIYQAYKTERDSRVMTATLWSLRTNGVLWAVAEALSIPTVNRPHYAVSAGAIGIAAGLVPTAFSIYALDYGNSGGKHERKPYPNMLAKIYSLPTNPRVEYPEAVWGYLSTPPASDARSRRQILTDHWLNDRNISAFKKGSSEHTLKVLTGHDQKNVSVDLLSDRLIMLREVKSVVLQMTRPLLELSMVTLNKKTFSADPNPPKTP